MTCDLARHWCAVLAVFVAATTLSTLALCVLALMALTALGRRWYIARRAAHAMQRAKTDAPSGANDVDQK